MPVQTTCRLMSENHKFLSEFSQLEKNVGDSGIQPSSYLIINYHNVDISGNYFFLFVSFVIFTFTLLKIAT